MGTVEDVSIPAQGPETHTHIKRWCAGSCMAIMAVMGSAYFDLIEGSEKLTHQESKTFWRTVKKKFLWLLKEVKMDLKIRGRNRDFTGIR